jgi:predicted nucleic acid-binding protein
MIILDNTVLTSFAYIDRLDIPHKLFGDVCLPESVYYEGVLKAKTSKRVERIRRSVEVGLIKVIKPEKNDIEFAEGLQRTLGIGERYTIAIGISKKCLIATDDLKPRRIAKELGLDIIGTLGILRLAYKKVLIDKEELRKLVKMLHDILYFTDDLEKWVLSDLTPN